MHRLKWISTRGYKTRESVERVLRSAGVDPKEGEWNVAVGIYGWRGRFDASDQRWRKLKEKAEEAAGGVLVGDFIEYTDAELAAAHMLDLRSTVERRGDTGPAYGNEYDTTHACPRCLSGAVLIPPFRIASKDLPRRRDLACTFRSELMVSGKLMHRLGAISGSEDRLAPVVDRKTGQALPWRAIIPKAVLPRVHPSTRGLIRETSTDPRWAPCAVCGRDRHGPTFDEAMELVYNRSEVWRNDVGLPRVAGTWELLGPGIGPDVVHQLPNAKPEVAQPIIVVNQEVAVVFRECADKWMKMAPVKLLD